MFRALDSAIAGLRAHQSKLDIIGNNIANVNTFGYKAQSFNFKEAMYQNVSTSRGGVQGRTAGTNGAQYGYGTLMGSISVDMSPSAASQVGGTAACLDGEGFFITSGLPNKNVTLNPDDAAGNTDAIKNAEFQYTRVGQFRLDGQGYLTDGTNFVYGFRPSSDGKGFDTDSMVALRVPTGAHVDADGNVSLEFDDTGEALQSGNMQINDLGEITVKIPVTDADGATQDKVVSIGKLAVANFQNQEGLMKGGGGYYTATSGDNSGACSATIPGGSTATLLSGYLETSNVDLAKEFAEMITTQRGFQANSKIITLSDEILSDIVSMKR